MARSNVDLPSVGLSFHPLLFDAMARGRFSFGFVDVPIELYFDTARAGLLDPGESRLQQIASRWPVVWRGSAFSLGSVEDPDDPAPSRTALRRFARLCEFAKPLALVETLGFRGLGARDLGRAHALPFSSFAADWIAARSHALQDAVGLPLIWRLAKVRGEPVGGELGEFEFLARLAESADCEFAFDVSDITRLAAESGLDEAAMALRLADLPVALLTLSGEDDAEWRTLDSAMAFIAPRAIVVRRTENLFPLDEIGAALQRSRALLEGRPGQSATRIESSAPPRWDRDAAAGLRDWQYREMDRVMPGGSSPAQDGNRPVAVEVEVEAWRNWRHRVDEAYKGIQIRKFLSADQQRRM